MVVLGYTDTTQVDVRGNASPHPGGRARREAGAARGDLSIGTYDNAGGGGRECASSRGGRRASGETGRRGQPYGADRGDRRGRNSADGAHRHAAAERARGGRLQSERARRGGSGAPRCRTRARSKRRAPFPSSSRSSRRTRRARITDAIGIPTIGIGSGEHCDGQILVTHDLIGFYPWFTPKFVSPEAHVAEEIRRAARIFIDRTRGSIR